MRIVIATDSPETRDLFRQAILGIGLECGAEDCIALDAVPGRLAHGSVDLLLVNQGADAATGLEAIRLAAAQAKVAVLATGPVDDPQRIMRALRAGAREYLDYQHPREELLAALAKLGPTSATDSRQGRLIAVTSACPGAGVTTVATGLAFTLSARQEQVVLAEVGNGVPELALDLDLEPRNSIADFIRDWHRMDTTMLRHALVEHTSGVQVLAYPPGVLVPEPWQAPALRQLLLLLRKTCDVAVLDLGHAAEGAYLEALLLADAIVVVTRLDVPGLRLSRHYLNNLLEAHAYRANIHVVANRYGQRRQLPWRSAQEALGMPMRAWLPENPAGVNEALNHGQPLTQAAPRGSLMRQFKRLAGELSKAMQANGFAVHVD